VKVFLGEVEKSEPVLIHEFDNSTDILDVHGERKVGVGVGEVYRAGALRSWKLRGPGNGSQAGTRTGTGPQKNTRPPWKEAG
jgi:hypothetical protein